MRGLDDTSAMLMCSVRWMALAALACWSALGTLAVARQVGTVLPVVLALTTPLVPMGAPVVLLMVLSHLSRLSRCVPAAGFVDFNLHNRILEAHKSLETHEDADAPSACCSCRFEHLCTYAYCVPLCMLSVTLCLDAGIW